MTAVKNTAVMYRSPAFRAARATLVKAEQVLPLPLYSALYRGAFRIYRTGLETQYALDLRRKRKGHDWASVRRGEAVRRALPYSLVGPQGLEKTYDAVIDVVRRGVPGDLVECGVAQGGGSAVMALALRDSGERRRLWLFDSFEGLPDPTADDYDPKSGATGAHIRPLPKGSCLGTYDEVHDLMSGYLGLSNDQYELVQGWFQDTVQPAAEKVGPIAVLRLDGDWYESTKVCLEGLYDNLSHGGLLIIDDYHSCFGAKRAVHEFLADRGDDSPDFQDDGSGGVLYVKP